MIGIRATYFNGQVILFLCHEESYARDVERAVRSKGKPRHMKLVLGPFTDLDRKDAILEDRYVGSEKRMQ